jgi:hypothetical protein
VSSSGITITLPSVVPQEEHCCFYNGPSYDAPSLSPHQPTHFANTRWLPATTNIVLMNGYGYSIVILPSMLTQLRAYSSTTAAQASAPRPLATNTALIVPRPSS